MGGENGVKVGSVVTGMRKVIWVGSSNSEDYQNRET